MAFPEEAFCITTAQKRSSWAESTMSLLCSVLQAKMTITKFSCLPDEQWKPCGLQHACTGSSTLGKNCSPAGTPESPSTRCCKSLAAAAAQIHSDVSFWCCSMHLTCSAQAWCPVLPRSSWASSHFPGCRGSPCPCACLSPCTDNHQCVTMSAWHNHKL